MGIFGKKTSEKKIQEPRRTKELVISAIIASYAETLGIRAIQSEDLNYDLVISQSSGWINATRAYVRYDCQKECLFLKRDNASSGEVREITERLEKATGLTVLYEG